MNISQVASQKKKEQPIKKIQIKQNELPFDFANLSKDSESDHPEKTSLLDTLNEVTDVKVGQNGLPINKVTEEETTEATEVLHHNSETTTESVNSSTDSLIIQESSGSIESGSQVIEKQESYVVQDLVTTTTEEIPSSTESQVNLDQSTLKVNENDISDSQETTTAAEDSINIQLLEETTESITETYGFNTSKDTSATPISHEEIQGNPDTISKQTELETTTDTILILNQAFTDSNIYHIQKNTEIYQTSNNSLGFESSPNKIITLKIEKAPESEEATASPLSEGEAKDTTLQPIFIPETSAPQDTFTFEFTTVDPTSDDLVTSMESHVPQAHNNQSVSLKESQFDVPISIVVDRKPEDTTEPIVNEV